MPEPRSRIARRPGLLPVGDVHLPEVALTRRLFASWTLLVVVVACSSGCVHRRLTIRSFPEGAVAYVDDQEIGLTPVSTPFTHYGVRTIRLERDGFETVEVDERVDAPWYLTPPLDFFVENFWPREIRDERVVDFEMVPLRTVPQSEVLERGEQLRQQTQQGLVSPLQGGAIR